MHGSKKGNKKKVESFKLLALVAYFFELSGLYRIYIWTQQFLIIMVGVLTEHDNKRQSNKQSLWRSDNWMTNRQTSSAFCETLCIIFSVKIQVLGNLKRSLWVSLIRHHKGQVPSSLATADWLAEKKFMKLIVGGRLAHSCPHVHRN